VLDKPAVVKSARARTAARMPMPIISTVAMPLDDMEHVYARRSSSQDLSFQESQRWANRVGILCFAKIEACSCRYRSMCNRHSAKLSRLLTAGTKSLFSLIAGESILKHADHSALEPSKQGNELQDWEVNQPHHSGTLEGPFAQQHVTHQMTFPVAVLRSKMQSLDFDPPQMAQPLVARANLYAIFRNHPVLTILHTGNILSQG
jgi:hypothetical protein